MISAILERWIPSVLLLMLISSATISSAFAFQTGNIMGNYVHREITLKGLDKLGFSSEVLEKVILNVNNQDNAFFNPSSLFLSDHHFDDNHIVEGANLIRERRKQIIDLALKSSWYPVTREKIYWVMGEMMHSAQDFYSHSNFLELQLKAKVKPESLQIVGSWKDVALKKNKYSKDLFTGYFFYNSDITNEETSSVNTCNAGMEAKYPKLKGKLKPLSEYCKHMKCTTGPIEYKSYKDAITNVTGKKLLLHYYLAKDDFPNYMEGRVMVPGTNKSLHSLAVDLAAKETEKLWHYIEVRIRAAKTQKVADDILRNIKTDPQLPTE